MSVERRRKQLRALLAEDLEREYQRYIDLCLVWELPGGDTLYVGGGQWDCEEERYTEREPENGRVIQLQESQVDAARQIIRRVPVFEAVAFRVEEHAVECRRAGRTAKPGQPHLEDGDTPDDLARVSMDFLIWHKET
jgi:hypothetical protein